MKKTYDPDALNWVNAPAYLKAAEIYNANTCEDRKVVKGRPAYGRDQERLRQRRGHVDARRRQHRHGRGGLVSIVSSKQYSFSRCPTSLSHQKVQSGQPQ